MQQLDGILVLNKPKGLSSAQCISRLKRLGQKKIGHGGTLDPMAEGVLLVLLGQATKLSAYLLEGGKKIYLGTLRLGLITDTWDIEGQVLDTWPLGQEIDETLVSREIDAWTDLTEQLVPAYSAAKHHGQPLYKLARQGKVVPAIVKKINISQSLVQEVNLPDVRFRVSCSSGSYIRFLAHSLGIRLGCGATLTQLTREYSHPFALDQAVNLDDLLADPEKLSDLVLPLTDALPGWKRFPIPGSMEEKLRNGTALPHQPEFGNFIQGERAICLDEQNLPLALLKAGKNQGKPVWTILRGLFNPK